MQISRKRYLALGLSGLAIASMLGGALAIHASNSHAASGGQGTLTNLKYLGQTSLTGMGSSAGSVSTGQGTDQVAPDSGDDAEFPHSGNGAIRVPASQVPQPASNPVSSDNSAVAAGFAGIDHFDSRTAGSGSYTGTQFSLEPPDQMLCVGGGYVFEGVNDALRVFDTSGAPKTDPIAINQFYGLAPAINRATGVRGAFVSDPKCYYDAPTHSWFVTVLATGQDAAGNLIAPAFTDVAVTTDSNPATASWSLYQIFGTDDGTNGTPSHAGCPCFGDQPLIGADANGFYVTTNEFPLAGPGFNGAQVYAMSKTGLESGKNTTVVHIDAGALPTPDAGGIWYSIQPATTPGNGYAANTEYFLSSLQFGPGALDNRIATWALTGTSTLGNRTPSVSLSNQVINSEVYGQPPASAQKSGSNPLGAVITSLEGTGKFNGNNPAQAIEFLNTNDDRMNQVVYANGNLFSGVNTVVGSSGATRSGIAYFVVSPSVSNGQVSGTMANQGYVSLEHNDVLFPAIGVNAAGKGVMSFTVAGPDYYPSAGYVTLDATHGAGAVHISGAGVGPEDGFVGYSPFANDLVARWGDYGAAVADANGNIWTAAEFIGQTCTLAQFEQDTTCGGTRTVLANWGTYVTEVKP